MHPQKGVVDSFSLYRLIKPSITFIVNRKVVSPVLFRNSEDDRAEIKEFNGKIHAQVNSEKFISQERNRGLHLLRHLTHENAEFSDWDDENERNGLISSEYHYNEQPSLTNSVNLDAITYGGAGVDIDTYSIKSHVVSGYVYSLYEYDIVNSETRNAVYESGTMRDSEGNQSSSLYNLNPVQPGNNFISFVTIEAGTPEMILYYLHNLLNTNKYGARETRHGKTINNEIMGIIVSSNPVSLSSGELVMEHHEQSNNPEDSVEKYIKEEMNNSWDVYSNTLSIGEDLPDWYNSYLQLVKEFEDENELYDILDKATEEYYNTLVSE